MPVRGPSRQGGAQGTVHFGLPIGGASPVDRGWFYSTGQGGVPSPLLCTQGSRQEPGCRSKAQEAPNHPTDPSLPEGGLGTGDGGHLFRSAFMGHGPNCLLWVFPTRRVDCPGSILPTGCGGFGHLIRRVTAQGSHSPSFFEDGHCWFRG